MRKIGKNKSHTIPNDLPCIMTPCRSSVLQNAKKQLRIKDDHNSEIATKNRNLKARNNAEAMTKYVTTSNILPADSSTDKDLVNPFTGKIATPAQQEDLLNFQSIGKSDFDAFVQHTYLGESSVQPTARRHRLKTFATPRTTKRQVNNLQKEKTLVAKCLKNRLLWAQMHGGKGETTQEQYLELPRALADEDSTPTKGQKSNTINFYARRYGDKAIQPAFPSRWHPDLVVIEGMFMINTTPLRIHSKLIEYVRHLVERYMGYYLKTGVAEVHIVFDDPGRMKKSPKAIEQTRRDATATNIGPNHEHVTFTDDMKVPSKWREVIECRTCKRQLVVYMGDAILTTGQYLLREGQKLVVAGAGEELDQDSAWYTTNLGIEQLAPAYKCTAGEGDTRVWLHVDRAPGKRKLVYSPDSDVPHIGLTSADLSSDDIIVQLSSMGTPLKLFNMNDFVECLKTDPDLHSIPPAHRGKILQVLYIATGCDFTSFFAGIGKATFLKAFFQYAQFITGLLPAQTNGSLAHINPGSNGFLAFVRLVGVAYFQKNRGAFEEETPVGLYNSHSKVKDVKERHKGWYNQIRAKVWTRISFEDHLPPSLEALELHWLRTTWVAEYWGQATNTTMNHLPLDSFGWNTSGDKLTIEWDSEANISAVRKTVAFLMHGCNCKTGCTTRRCKCFKAGEDCGPGCGCTSCLNASGKEGT